VGNVMIDTMLRNRKKAEAATMIESLSLKPRKNAVITLHSPANVDNPQTLAGLVDMLDAVQSDMPVIFPIHPRTNHHLMANGLKWRRCDAQSAFGGAYRVP